MLVRNRTKATSLAVNTTYRVPFPALSLPCGHILSHPRRTQAPHGLRRVQKPAWTYIEMGLTLFYCTTQRNEIPNSERTLRGLTLSFRRLHSAPGIIGQEWLRHYRAIHTGRREHLGVTLLGPGHGLGNKELQQVCPSNDGIVKAVGEMTNAIGDGALLINFVHVAKSHLRFPGVCDVRLLMCATETLSGWNGLPLSSEITKSRC